MGLTRGFTDEIRGLNAEPIIGAAKDELLDDTLTRVGKHINIPLRLYASTPADEYLNIGASTVEAGDGAGKAVPPVDSALPVIAAGQIAFVSKTAPAYVKENGTTFSFPTTTAGQYRRLAFSVDGLGNLNAVWSDAAATVGALTDPGLLHAQAAGTPVGYIDLEALATAGTYKTAGSTTSVIENKVSTDLRIVRYGSGSATGGAGGGASLLDPNYDETYLYYTRSDFAIDKKTFYGSTTGTETILGLGKIVLNAGQNFISSNLLGPVFLADNPVVNTAQVRLLYKAGKVDNNYTFTVTAANATAGAVYSNNLQNFTVLTTITGGTSLLCSANGTPAASGTLTKVSGTGDATIAFSAVTYLTIQLSADGGSNWTTSYRQACSGRFVVADFVMPTGTTSTDLRMKIVSGTASSELNGFGVNMVQDLTAYSGDATFETRIVTSTEASTGLITLTQVRFTPGAHQLHCIYNGHDFVAPTFTEMGGGAVQFPTDFFVTGDVIYFWVAYGLINQTNAPITINNMLSTNSTLGSVAIPSGFTLDKPWMDVPAGATISGAGNISSDGVITGTGLIATTGLILSRGKAPTQPKYDVIEEATAGKGVKFPNGITFGTTLLSSYIEDDSSLASLVWIPNGVGSTNTGSAAARITRIGRQVSIRLAQPTAGTSAGSSSALTSSVSLPSYARPAITVVLTIPLLQSTGWSWGMIEISTAGTMSIYSGTMGGIANGTCNIAQTSVTFNI